MSDTPTAADLDLVHLRAWHHAVQGTLPGEVHTQAQREEHHAYRAAQPGVIVDLDATPKTGAGQRGKDARRFRGPLAFAMRSLHSLSPDELAAAKRALSASGDDEAELFTLRYLHAVTSHLATIPRELDWRTPEASDLAAAHLNALGLDAD